METREQAEQDLRDWAANNARRDDLVRAANLAGVSKNRIHTLTGIARTTIDRIVPKETGMPSKYIETYKQRDLIGIAIGIAEDTSTSPAGYHYAPASRDRCTVPWQGLLDDGLIRLVVDDGRGRVELTEQGAARLAEIGADEVAEAIAAHNRQRPERHHYTVTAEDVLAYHHTGKA